MAPATYCTSLAVPLAFTSSSSRLSCCGSVVRRFRLCCSFRFPLSRPELTAQLGWAGCYSNVLGDSDTASRPNGVETRHTRTQTILQNPLTRTAWGTNALAGRVCQVCVQNRNVQPLYFNHYPRHPLIISIKPRSPFTRHRMRSAQFTTYSTTNPVHCMPYLSH